MGDRRKGSENNGTQEKIPLSVMDVLEKYEIDSISFITMYIEFNERWKENQNFSFIPEMIETRFYPEEKQHIVLMLVFSLGMKYLGNIFKEAVDEDT